MYSHHYLCGSNLRVAFGSNTMEITHNMKSIIFDYNRTIYNPEEGIVFPGSLEILQKYKDAGFVLFLVAKGGIDRKNQIKDLNIEHFFKKIIVHPEKTKDDFIDAMNECAEKTVFFVVGDRVKKEIRFGNECDMTTIWLKNGKFKDEEPELDIEKPDHVIHELSELESVILRS